MTDSVLASRTATLEAAQLVVRDWLQLRCFDHVSPKLFGRAPWGGDVQGGPGGDPVLLDAAELEAWLQESGDSEEFDYAAYGGALAVLAVHGLAYANHLSSHTAAFQAGVARHGDDELLARTSDARLGRDGVGAIALTESAAGSDLGAQRTRLRARGESYVVEGHKRYITLGQSAAWFLVSGTPVYDRQGRAAELVPALVPRGSEVHAEPESSSSTAIASVGLAGVRFNSCVVPGSNLLRDGRAAIASILAHDRFSVLFMALGLAIGAAGRIAMFAERREQFGSRLLDHQAYSFAVARMAEALVTMDSVCRLAVGEMQRGALSPQRLAAMKAAVVDASVEVCGTATRLGGARSFTAELGVARIFEEATMLEPGGGTTDMQRTIVARSLARSLDGPARGGKHRG